MNDTNEAAMENPHRREADYRLDRIEQKLDQVADALQTLARTEEKLLAANRRLDVIERKMETGYQEHLKLLDAAKDAHINSMLMDRLVMRMDALEEMIQKMNVRNAESNVVLDFFQRFGWIVVTAAIGVGAYYMKS